MFSAIECDGSTVNVVDMRCNSYTGVSSNSFADVSEHCGHSMIQASPIIEPIVSVPSVHSEKCDQTLTHRLRCCNSQRAMSEPVRIYRSYKRISSYPSSTFLDNHSVYRAIPTSLSLSVMSDSGDDDMHESDWPDKDNACVALTPKSGDLERVECTSANEDRVVLHSTVFRFDKENICPAGPYPTPESFRRNSWFFKDSQTLSPILARLDFSQYTAYSRVEQDEQDDDVRKSTHGTTWIRRLLTLFACGKQVTK
jgi:hypothetical protein